MKCAGDGYTPARIGLPEGRRPELEPFEAERVAGPGRNRHRGPAYLDASHPMIGCMAEHSTSRRTVLRWISTVALFVGACSLLSYFFTIPQEGPAHPWAAWTLVAVPLVAGLVGGVCGALSRSWPLLALNLLLVFGFPLTMLFGTALLGP